MFDTAIMKCLIVALATIFLDVIMGILLSVKNGSFSLNKLPQFLATNIVPYMGGLIVLAVFANYVSDLSYAFYAGTALVAVKFSKEALIDKIKALLS